MVYSKRSLDHVINSILRTAPISVGTSFPEENGQVCPYGWAAFFILDRDKALFVAYLKESRGFTTLIYITL